MKPDAASPRSNPAVDTVPDAAQPAISEASEERVWVERARSGDEEAFRKLVERHADRAYGLAFRMLGSAAEAEEAAQDAFLRAWRALPRFRGECAFSTWLHRIVVRRSLDRQEVLRSRRAREAPLDDADPGSLASPATEPEGSPATLKIERLLGSLSEVQRAVVLLYYYEDRSVEEVSRALDMATGTVKTHLHRARAALRASWQAEEEGTDA